MAKITKRTNFRVVVEPETRIYGIRLDRVERECENIVDQIKRHVDGVHSAYVEHDTEVVCSHCGYEWEEEDGIPQCCTKAQVEAAAEKFKF